MKQNQIHQNLESADATALFRKVSVATGVTLLASIAASKASTDYGPAIWRPTCNANYYTSGFGHKFHVVHDMEGYYASTISLFTSCSYTSASVHYAVNGVKDATSDYPAGEITQMVLEANYAWHALCWNQHSTGTEHEGFVSNPAWYTDAQYQASAGISKHVAEKFGYAKDRNHIVGHNEKSSGAWVNYANANLGIDPNCNTHTDPGQYWDWTKYMALVNPAPVNGHINPCVGINSDGRQELFAVGHTGNLYHQYWTGTAWSGWLVLGNWVSAQNAIPSVQRNKDGRLEVFIIGSNGALNHIYQQTTGNSSSWSGWSSIPTTWTFSQTASVVANTNQDGRIEVFTISATDGGLRHVWQNVASGSTNWSAFADLGGQWNQSVCISAGNDLDGRQEVFLIGNTGNVYHINQTAPNGGWSGFVSLGATFPQTQRTALARNADGRLEIFAIWTDNQLYHLWQTAANGGWTGSWASLGGTWNQAAKPIVGLNQNGVLEVMVIGNTGNIYHDYFSGGVWSGWLSLGGSFTQDIRPVMGRNSDGRLEVFTTGPNTDLLHMYQNTPNGTWSGWTSLGGSWN
jgi:hypothetical protein